MRLDTRGCTDTVRESALEVVSWRKTPCRTGDSNLLEYCAWLFSQSTIWAIPSRPWNSVILTTRYNITEEIRSNSVTLTTWRSLQAVRVSVQKQRLPIEIFVQYSYSLLTSKRAEIGHQLRRKNQCNTNAAMYTYEQRLPTEIFVQYS